VIRLAVAADLPAAERYGLDVLLDLSRLLVVDDTGADTVRVTVADDPVDAAAFTAGRWRPPHADGEVRVSRDALRHVADLAGAGEEQRATARDRHGRVPADANPLVRAGVAREPVVSRHAGALRGAVVAAAGRRPVRLVCPWPDGRRWAAALTHDLDVVAGWPVFTALRIGELLRGGELGRAARVLRAALAAAARDPVGAAARSVSAIDHAAGARATWFVLAGRPTPATWRRGDVTYRVESTAARRIVTAAAAHGAEIALHGTFATGRDADRFLSERQQLATVAGGPPVGVRQHFLRLQPGVTQRGMVAAGFSYDATYGFSDRNGFRLGVADVVPGWDAERQRPSGLEEVPLIWMDRALSKYAGVEDPVAWVRDALELAERCREVEGLWVGLWHPNLTPALGYPDAPAAYVTLVREVTRAPTPWIAPLAEIVAWRVARRRVRARRIAEDGRVELAAPPAAYRVLLEDGTGKAAA